jgi:putative ABC transport system ATP-binding protein
MRLLRAATQRAVAGGVVTHEAQLASWDDRCLLRDGLIVDHTVAPPGPSRSSRPVIGDGDAGQKGRDAVVYERP